MTVWYVAALCALLATTRLTAQRVVPTVALDKSAREFAEPFTELRGLVELRDGRVLIFDAQEKEIRLVDIVRGTMSRAARAGAGPLEVSPTGILLRGASDSVVYYDIAQRRFLLFSPAGAPARTISLGASDPRAMLTQALPVAVDAAGLVYGQSIGLIMPAGESTSQAPTFLDTVVIVRRDLRTDRTDTVARARAPLAQSKPRMEMIGSTVKMVITGPDFRSGDVWTVVPDGRLALLSNGDYRVRFINPGATETSGPPVPHALIPITPAMRRESMDSARSQVKAQLARTNKAMSEMQAQAGVAAGGATMPNIQVDVIEPASWATHLPPYMGIQSSPDGMLWVTVLKSVSDAGENHDVLDGAGALVAHVRLAPQEKIIGLGRGTVYTIRTDSDDLQYLRRYTLPPFR